MKKNQNSMHNLGEELELEEFMNNNSTHEFSKDYINKKNNLLNSVGHDEKVKKIRKRNFVAAWLCSCCASRLSICRKTDYVRIFNKYKTD